MDQKQLEQWFNNRQPRYDQTQNHIAGKLTCSLKRNIRRYK